VIDMPALSSEIRELAREHEAVILAHNYQRAEFAGVHFMAETAKILAPDKTVLLPEPRAGCPMADMITGEALAAWKAEHPGVPVVTYVNSSAEVKAESDVCVTSANAVAVVRALGAGKILFAPDRNLGSWVARSLPDLEVLLWDGWCPTHDDVTIEQVRAARAEHPTALVMAHPECRSHVVDLADAVLSTSQMLGFAAQNPADEFIVVTEAGLVHGLQKAAPGKRFFELSPRMLCPNMKLTTLAKVRDSLASGSGEVTIEESVRERALLAVERMVAIG